MPVIAIALSPVVAAVVVYLPPMMLAVPSLSATASGCVHLRAHAKLCQMAKHSSAPPHAVRGNLATRPLPGFEMAVGMLKVGRGGWEDGSCHTFTDSSVCTRELPKNYAIPVLPVRRGRTVSMQAQLSKRALIGPLPRKRESAPRAPSHSLSRLFGATVS